MNKDRAGQLIAALVVAVFAAVLAKELRQPAGERRWHGALFGVVPYDLRPPTVARLRRRLWNPNDPHLVTGQAFGIGWSINLGRLARRFGLA